MWNTKRFVLQAVTGGHRKWQ